MVQALFSANHFISQCSSSKHSYEISYELLDGSFEEKRLGKLIIGILLNNLSKINTKFVSY